MPLWQETILLTIYACAVMPGQRQFPTEVCQTTQAMPEILLMEVFAPGLQAAWRILEDTATQAGAPARAPHLYTCLRCGKRVKVWGKGCKLLSGYRVCTAGV